MHIPLTRRATRLLAAIASVIVALANSLAAQHNLDFEAPAAGETIAGWFIPTPGFAATAVARQAPGEGHCARLHRTGDGRMGNLMQTFDGKPFRGRYVRLRAEVRVRTGDSARLWMRVDRPDHQRGFFDSMGDRPVTGKSWRRYEIIGKVDADAVRIAIGMMLQGETAFIDDVDLSAIELPPGAGPETARPLQGQAHRNVSALARLVGLVRYFHPSTEASAIDWTGFTIAAVRAVESAKSDPELLARLHQIFATVAPTVRVATDPARLQVPPALQAPQDQRGVDIVAWRHMGLGLGQKGIYHSEVVAASLSGGALGVLFGKQRPDDLPKPAAPLHIELVDGLHCALPLALYRRGHQTVPVADAAPPRAAPLLSPSAEDRATRLAAVILGWNVFQHFYPYFDVVEVDWRSALYTALSRAAQDAGPAEFLVTLREMVARLHDGHGYVGHHADPDTAALPVHFAWAGDQLVIESVERGVAGLLPGDCVTHFHDQPVAKVIEGLALRVSAATPQFERYRVLTDLRRGRPGRDVSLRVRRGDKTVGMRLSYLAGVRPQRENRPDAIAELAPGICYVDIDRATTDEFKAALPRLTAAKGIVFDFRGYPNKLDAHVLFSHLIEKPVRSAQWHIPIPRRPDRMDLGFHASHRWLIRPHKPHIAAKLVFITDGRAISYAESCMGIVEHYQLGAIVGEATAGTNGNVNPFTLPGGYRISWTGMKVLKHDGARHHGVGIRPTVPLQRTVAGIRQGRDEFLERAVELLKPH